MVKFYAFDKGKKAARKTALLVKDNIKGIFLIVLGIFSASFGLKGFLLPNQFIDGGVTGISLLVAHATGLPLSILAFKQISKTFALKTFLAIVGLSLVLAIVSFPTITYDKLLIAIFGGLFLGVGLDYQSEVAVCLTEQRYWHCSLEGRLKHLSAIWY
jgi:uncharacterized membrane-anchored protein YitT (DUF2179 family)